MVTSISRAKYYAKTTAIADQVVLRVNGWGSLRTICTWLSGVYGERDRQSVPSSLGVLQRRSHRYQVGDEKACSIGYQRQIPHELTCSLPKFFLQTESGSGKVEGEAFFITGGNPVPFWTSQRQKMVCCW